VSRQRVTFIGEGMLELSGSGGAGWKLGHGGDTLNSAVHMARLGCDVAYFTALGGDPFSDQLRGAWLAEGLDCSLVLTDPERGAGLYAISVDAAGERSFTYWRGESAARRMFALPGSDEAASRAAQSDLLAFSLISLAILPPEGRAALLDIARKVRAAGGMVAFDGNYRPRLWASQAEAAEACDAGIAAATIGLPTLDDEAALTGETSADEVAQQWQSLGCVETVVKLGAAGCRLPDGTIVQPEMALSPVDTSGAGDAFNAGYLGARLAGDAPAQAAVKGHRLAGWTIMRAGAIPPRDQDAPYS